MALFVSSRDGSSPLSKVHVLASSSTSRSPSALPQSLSQSSPEPRRHRGGDKARRMTVREAAERKRQAMDARRRLTEKQHAQQQQQQQQQHEQRQQQQQRMEG